MSAKRISCGLALLGAFALLAARPAAAVTVPEETVVAAVEPDPLYDAVGDDLDSQGEGFPDPLEPVNRGTFEFNQALDRWLLSPFTTVYRFLVPEIGRQGIRNALANLNTPAILINDLLQLELHDAGVTTARFIANTTFGVAGFIDVAAIAGMPGHHSDFGQTLARAGVDSGPYLVLPVFGPTTLRDGTGTVVDVLLRPGTYFLAGADSYFMLTSIQTGGEGLSQWESRTDNLRMLDESSIDFYAALRSAYFQNRMAQIKSREE